MAEFTHIRGEEEQPGSEQEGAGQAQEDQDAGVDYIQVMQNNLEALKKAIK